MSYWVNKRCVRVQPPDGVCFFVCKFIQEMHFQISSAKWRQFSLDSIGKIESRCDISITRGPWVLYSYDSFCAFLIFITGDHVTDMIYAR